MTVTQVYELMNTVTNEVLGDSAVVEENLQNVVELGQAFENAHSLDNFVRSLNDHIGRVVFVNRVYKGRVPSVLRDGWEYGAILEKISADLINAEEDESWELTDRASYDVNIFYKPTVSVAFWNDRVTFEIPISITEKQVKSAFSSAEQLNAFVSMLYTAVEKSMTVKIDALVMRAINNFIGETVHNEYSGASLSSKSGIRAVNLLYLYNETLPESATPLTADDCLFDGDFIRFASKTMRDYQYRLSVLSKLFNIGGKDRFTSPDLLHTVLLAEFETSAGSFLYDANGQFMTGNIKLPDAETVPYWQGSGPSFNFSSTGKVDVVTSAGNDVTVTGVLGVMFDRDALGVNCADPRVTTNYNAKAEFWNEYHKWTGQLFNDQNENFVVFFVA